MQDVKVDRNKYIGGSDIPTIMNLNPFKKRFNLLLAKADLIHDDFDGNEYTEYGNILEPQIRNYCSEYFDTIFREDKLIVGDLRSHVDGYDGMQILEIKTTSKIHNKLDDYKTYLVQLLFYMQNYGCEFGTLAVYERPADFNTTFDKNRLSIYQININDYKELVDEINVEIEKFRKDLAKVKANPFITEEELQPTALIELSNKVVELENKLAEYKELEKQYKSFKEKLYEAMIEYGVDKWTTNNDVKITLVNGSADTIEIVDEFNIEKFKEENPELFNQYIEKKQNIKNGRKGFVKITLPKKKGK